MKDNNLRTAVVVGGNRIPFAKSGGAYASASNQDMLTAALDGLVARFGLAGQQVADRGGQDLGVGAGVRARVGAEDLARTGDEGGGGDGGGVQAQEEHPTSVVPAPGGASRLSRAAGARPPSADRSP